MKHENYFENHDSFAETLYDLAERGVKTAAALFFDDAKEVTRELLMYPKVDIGYIELSDSIYDNYSDEYYISLSDDMKICVERARVNDKYLGLETDVFFIDEAASDEIIGSIRVTGSHCYSFFIGNKSEDVVKDDIEHIEPKSEGKSNIDEFTESILDTISRNRDVINKILKVGVLKDVSLIGDKDKPIGVSIGLDIPPDVAVDKWFDLFGI